jgi:hypothetical protein
LRLVVDDDGFGTREPPRSGPTVVSVGRRIPADDRTNRGEASAVELFWLPLGAGGHSVRLNGRVYEGLSALRRHRRAHDLYHSALQVSVPEDRFVIEMTPVRQPQPERQIIATGAVGAAWAARWKIGRYEVCCWRDGTIPDVAEAVDSPRPMTTDSSSARDLLEILPALPTPVWGRDELKTGDMWNAKLGDGVAAGRLWPR